MHGSSAMNSKLKKINKEFISRLTASLECYKEIKKANYLNVLPLAERYIFFVRQQLLVTDKSTGIDRLKFRLFIDKKITKELSPLPIIKIYLRKLKLGKR